MARKKPSRHTADQFALFLETIRDSLEGDQGAKFAEALGKLIRNNNGAVTAAQPAAPEAPKHSTPPEKPPFEQAARSTATKHHTLLQLMGQLELSWSNNESLLVYVLMLLLGTDERSAAAVFATLNTTRARLELVRRLMMLKVTDAAVRSALEAVMDRFSDAGRIRNELLHAMYSINEQGEITHTQAMRFVEKGGRLSFGDRQPVDDKRFAELKKIISELTSLNRSLWDLLPRLKQAIGRSAAAPSATGSRRD